MEVDYTDQSEEKQIALVQYDPSRIMQIKNPSIAVQLAAVKKIGYAIEQIKDPCIAVQLAAVKENGYVIELIEDPCIAVQRVAIHYHHGMIDFIRSPDQEVQLLAFDVACREFLGTLKEIYDTWKRLPSRNDIDFQLKIVEKYPWAIQFMMFFDFEKNIEVQELAIKKDPSLLVKHPFKFSPEIKEKYSHLILAGDMGIFEDD